jgi:hypothetical protein
MSIHNGPWIMALMWPSIVTPNAYYIGFEDLPTDPDNFHRVTPEGYANDGDYNDFVYLIEGITCEGGGLPCMVDAEGACGFGLTECDANGNIVCRTMGQQTEEVCDNIDNNCDGLVDNGEGLCDPGFVCDRGRCRQHCAGGEFPCSDGLECEDATGLCVDPNCIGVVCEPGKICLGGECAGGCEGAVCPIGQSCQLGRCFDPCAARAPDGPDPCDPGTVCEGGICVEGCQCRACPAGFVCNLQSGKCEDQLCNLRTEPCAPPLVCQNGECIDPCVEAICPGGGICADAECGPPRGGPTGSVNPDGDGIGPIVVGDEGAAVMTCEDTCETANNEICEDGGPDATANSCALGTDCADCGLARGSTICKDTCATSNNGICEDGQPGSEADTCALGTDCTDCGDREDPNPPATKTGGRSTTTAAADPSCGCRTVTGGQRAVAAPGLLLLVLGLSRLRRTNRRRQTPALPAWQTHLQSAYRKIIAASSHTR